MVWIWAWAATEAVAGPSAGLCDQWRAKLAEQAQSLAGVDHAFASANIKVEKAKVRFDNITASIRNGVCQLRAAGDVDLRGQVQVALYGMSTACQVSLSRAPVVTRLDVTGTSTTPKIVSSVADIEGLRSKMSLCVNLDVVKGLVVDIANDWIGRHRSEWHGAIEQQLAQ
ncbi:MAG: hypothetical protein AAGA48_29490 [Myxococcota bacterium]